MISCSPEYCVECMARAALVDAAMALGRAIRAGKCYIENDWTSTDGREGEAFLAAFERAEEVERG